MEAVRRELRHLEEFDIVEEGSWSQGLAQAAVTACHFVVELLMQRGYC